MLIVTALGSSTACSSKSSPGTPIVGAGGGTVVTADGTAVDVPEGALTSDAVITITPTTEQVPASLATPVGPSYQFSPEGQQFAVPATVTLTVDPSKLPAGKTLNDVLVYWTPQGKAEWVALPTTVLDETHVFAPTTHFSSGSPGVPGDCQPGYARALPTPVASTETDKSSDFSGGLRSPELGQTFTTGAAGGLLTSVSFKLGLNSINTNTGRVSVELYEGVPGSTGTKIASSSGATFPGSPAYCSSISQSNFCVNYAGSGWTVNTFLFGAGYTLKPSTQYTLLIRSGKNAFALATDSQNRYAGGNLLTCALDVGAGEAGKCYTTPANFQAVAGSDLWFQLGFASPTTCAPIDNCVTNNGGCDTNATCTSTGPGTNTCACKDGYTGNGQAGQCAAKLLVTATGDQNEMITPASQSVVPGTTASFTVTANSGYVLSPTVTGDCPAGSWNGGVYTTGPITAACSVGFSAALPGIALGTPVCSWDTNAPSKCVITIPMTVTGTVYGVDAKLASSQFPQDFWVYNTPYPVVGSGILYTYAVGNHDCTQGWKGAQVHWSTSSTSNTGGLTTLPGFSCSEGKLKVSATGDGNVQIAGPAYIGSGQTASYSLKANNGHTISPEVTGSCPAGSWIGTGYTTGPITADCSVGFKTTTP